MTDFTDWEEAERFWEYLEEEVFVEPLGFTPSMSRFFMNCLRGRKYKKQRQAAADDVYCKYAELMNDMVEPRDDFLHFYFLKVFLWKANHDIHLPAGVFDFLEDCLTNSAKDIDKLARMSTLKLLLMVYDNPESFGLAEYPWTCCFPPETEEDIEIARKRIGYQERCYLS